MSKIYDAVYAQRYTSNGEERTKWINCGAVFETEKGMSLKLDTIPVGFDGWIKFFEPKEREVAEQPPRQEFRTGSNQLDAIPF